MVYHVLNRANARMQIFDGRGDYELFERVLAEAHQRVAMRTISYCLMPNHWHLVLWPRKDGDLSEFMRWLTVTHTQRWHAARGTAGRGHVYQGRFKSFPVADDGHYLTVCRYVERNALRAGLAERAEQWRWGSLWLRVFGDAEQKSLLADGPLPWPADWLEFVNRPETQEELSALRTSVVRSRPFGEAGWVKKIAAKLGLLATVRSRGRPRKDERRSHGRSGG
jgi:putative transposase